jgi:glucosamine-6-phosphate deaminase
MEVVIAADSTSGGSLVGQAISDLLQARPDAALGLATGSSPEPVYDDLVTRFHAGTLSMARARAFLLDEYVGLAPDHPQSYRSVIERAVVSRLDFRPGSVSGPDGRAGDLLAACARYDVSIAAAGGIDLQLLGIGSDGHIGFRRSRTGHGVTMPGSLTATSMPFLCM